MNDTQNALSAITPAGITLGDTVTIEYLSPRSGTSVPTSGEVLHIDPDADSAVLTLDDAAKNRLVHVKPTGAVTGRPVTAEGDPTGPEHRLGVLTNLEAA